MSQNSKTLRRLCLATGAVTVAGVLPVLAALPAFASNVASATLAVSPTTASAASNSTVSFTSSATGAIAAGGTITLNSLATAGGALVLPASAGNYTVTAGGVSDPVTNTNPSTGTTNTTETLTVQNAIAASTAVTIQVVGTQNPASGTDYEAVSTSGDSTAVNTNTVQIGTAAANPTVSQVNPNTLPAGTADPFTVTGTNFSTDSPSTSVTYYPQVTFTPVGGTGTNPAVTATGVAGNSTTLTGSVAGLVGGVTYNVQVANPTSASTTTTPAYGTPSAVTSADQAKAVTGLTYVPESGQRAVDTRIGQNVPRGMVPSNGSESVSLSALEAAANVPTTATAIAMNVTAIGETGPGNLQVYTGATAPGTSTVNFTPGVDTGNFSIVSTGGNSTVTLTDQGSAVDVTVDVVGYFTGNFTPTNTRLLDTRPGTLASAGGSVINGPLASREVYSLHTTLQPGTTVALNATAVDPNNLGNLRVFPEPSTGPSASTVPNTAVVQYVPGTDTGSYLITKVGNNGNIDLYSDSNGTVNVVIDESGYESLAPTASTPGLVALTPFRDFDSRPNGIGIRTVNPVTIGNTGTFGNGVPSSAYGAIVSVSAIHPASLGNLRTFPDGAAVPNTSTINYYVGHDRENLSVVALNNGMLDLYNDSNGTVNSTVDVLGYIGS